MRPQESILTTENGNPTASDGGATTADPIDRIEAYLAAQDGGDSDPTTDEGGDNSAANPTDKPADGEQGKDQEPQFTTTHLAQHLGLDESLIDVDGDGQPVFKTKIDGKESPVKFADLLKSYQLQGHAENTTREAAAIKQAAQARMQEADQLIQARFQHVDQQMQQIAEIAQIQQQDLNQDYASINWPELWQTDPGRAGMLRDQFQAKAARIQTALQTANQRRQVAQHQAMQQQQVNAYRSLQTEAAKLMEVIPEWNDNQTATKERSELTQWALGRGYDPSYLDALHNARVPNAAVVIRDMRNAWKHDTLQKSQPEIENRLRTAPKLIKPGQAASQADRQAAGGKALLQGIRNASPSHSTKAFEAYLLGTNQA